MTISDQLQFYIDMTYSLTFGIEDQFSSIYKYQDRLVKFITVYQDKVKALRKMFLTDYHNSEDFKLEYHDYMEEELNYIMFVNLNVSAVDPRKFSKKWYKKNVIIAEEKKDKKLNRKEKRIKRRKKQKKPLVRFTAYWYQVLLWEIYTRYSIAYWKSRDIGLSFSIIAGEIMGLMHKEGAETIFMSRIEKDVDMTDDRTQTNMGRGRKMVEDTVIYSLDGLYKDKYLVLYGEETAGIKGANIAGAGRQGRFERGFDDEAGAQKKIGDVVEAVTMAVTTVAFAGTLKPASDAGFRKIIHSGKMLEPEYLRGMFDDFKKNVEAGNSYTEAWDLVFDDLEEIVPEGTLLSFTNTFKDHPLKSGHCDYFKIECNRLLNDEVVIAGELLADLNAGSPDRSFYSLTNDHFEEVTIDQFEGFQVMMGFDPGSHGTAAMTPVIEDDYGFYYIMKSEIFNKGSMKEWISKLQLKYGKFTVFAEQSVKSYEKAGSGWMSVLRQENFETVIVSNRHMDDQLLVVNEVFRRKLANDNGDMELAVKIDHGNKWYGMSYIYGEKNSDVNQRRMSHPAEALVAVIYHHNKHILDGARKEWSSA